jgi:hypothetical protein
MVKFSSANPPRGTPVKALLFGSAFDRVDLRVNAEHGKD